MNRHRFTQKWDGPLDEEGRPHGQVSMSCGQAIDFCLVLPWLRLNIKIIAFRCRNRSCMDTACGTQPRLHRSHRCTAAHALKPRLAVQGTMTYPPPPPKEDKEDEGDEEKPVDVFTGTMVHGVRQGKGKYTWASGAVFEGEYVEGSKQCEQGTMIYLDKGRYEGAHT